MSNDFIDTIIICVGLGFLAAFFIATSIIKLSKDEKEIEDLEQEEYLKKWEESHSFGMNRRKK